MDDNSVRLVFDSESDGELPRHLWPTSGLGWLRRSAQPHRRPCVRVRSSFARVSRRTQRARLYSLIENGADARCMGITCYTVRPTARCMYCHWSTMARVFNRWPFGQPSTSDLLQSQGEIKTLTVLAQTGSA